MKQLREALIPLIQSVLAAAGLAACAHPVRTTAKAAARTTVQGAKTGAKATIGGAKVVGGAAVGALRGPDEEEDRPALNRSDER